MKAYSTGGTARQRKELPEMRLKGSLYRQGNDPWGAMFSGTGPDGRRYVIILDHEECLDVIRTAADVAEDLVEKAIGKAPQSHQ